MSPREKLARRWQRQLDAWFIQNEYANPNDWAWYWHIKQGIFCWSESKQVGFYFSELHGPWKDKLLSLLIPESEPIEMQTMKTNPAEPWGNRQIKENPAGKTDLIESYRRAKRRLTDRHLGTGPRAHYVMPDDPRLPALDKDWEKLHKAFISYYDRRNARLKTNPMTDYRRLRAGLPQPPRRAIARKSYVKGKTVFYRMRTDKGTFGMTGFPVRLKALPGFRFIVHRDPFTTSAWSVAEFKTGRIIGKGRNRTAAVARANHAAAQFAMNLAAFTAHVRKNSIN
jgi:hypothetical protein